MAERLIDNPCGETFPIRTGWFLAGKWNRPEVAEAQQRARAEAQRAAESTGTVVYHLTEAFKAKLEALDLTPQRVREELDRTGKVLRHKAGTLAEPVTDARITAVIKGKLALDSELSARDISVSTERGHVTLSGRIASPELVGRATLLALETDGVLDVTANLRVEPVP